MPQTKEEKNAKQRARRAAETPEEKEAVAARMKKYKEDHREEITAKRTTPEAKEKAKKYKRAKLLAKNPDALEENHFYGTNAERFEHYLDRTVTVPVDDRAVSDCPEEPCLTGWTAYRGKDGYPQMRANGRIVSVHRWLYINEHGEIPEGLELRHLCNNGHLGCLQIYHLQLGTKTENAADRVAAGTARRSLSADQVRGIKVMVKIGYTNQQQLADWYRTTKGTIGRIVRGETYREIKI